MENSRTIRAPMVAVYDQASSEADIRLPPQSSPRFLYAICAELLPLLHHLLSLVE